MPRKTKYPLALIATSLGTPVLKMFVIQIAAHQAVGVLAVEKCDQCYKI
jgi:hypothetical protein